MRHCFFFGGERDRSRMEEKIDNQGQNCFFFVGSRRKGGEERMGI